MRTETIFKTIILKNFPKMKENGDMESLVKGLTNRGRKTNKWNGNK